MKNRTYINCSLQISEECNKLETKVSLTDTYRDAIQTSTSCKKKRRKESKTDFLQMTLESNPNHFRSGLKGSHSTRGKEAKQSKTVTKIS